MSTAHRRWSTDWARRIRAGGPDHHRGTGSYRGYATTLRTALPHAVRVLDAFHVVCLGCAAVEEVRRRIQQQTTGHRGRKDDPLSRIRRLLRRGHEHHAERSCARLLAGLDAGDTRRTAHPAPGSLPRTCG